MFLLGMLVVQSEKPGRQSARTSNVPGMGAQLAVMVAERSEGSEEQDERSHLPSEQELLEGMQAVQAAVAAAEREQGDAGVLPSLSDSRPSTPGDPLLALIALHGKLYRPACILHPGLKRWIRAASRAWLFIVHGGCCAGIFVGMAGQDTAMGMEFESGSGDHDGLTEEEWKRATYPAGRIMHLVPAHLISGACTVLRLAPPCST